MTTAVHRDPGLQPERTLLAWRRTTLTAVGVLLLCGRAFLHDHSVTHAVAVLLGVAVVGALGLGLAHRGRRYRADPQCRQHAPTVLLMLIAIGIACVGVVMAVGIVG